MHLPGFEIIPGFYPLKCGKCWVIICWAALFCKSKIQIPQRVIPRLWNTAAKGDFSGICKNCGFWGVEMGGGCYLRYKTSHIGWHHGLQWGTLKFQEVWSQLWRNFWEVPELHFPGLNLCVRGWSCQEAANNLLSPKHFKIFSFRKAESELERPCHKRVFWKGK